MKGFNIAPNPGSGQLAPVAEFIANLQAEPETPHHHDLFGSTISGILGGSHTFPKKSNPLHMSLHGPPSSAPPFGTSMSLDGAGAHRQPHKLHSKRSSANKRRWGTLIEAAKAGRVSKLINRSRSEDSVACQSNSPNSPNSDDSQSGSNPSLAEAFTGFGLAALRRKRKKFSASRSKNSSNESKNVSLTTISAGCAEPKARKVLKRASSVPARSMEPTHTVRFAEHSNDEVEDTTQDVEMTPSTTEESVAAEPIKVEATPVATAPVLLTTTTRTQPSLQTAQPPQQAAMQQPCKSRNGSAVLPNLPGIQPVSGHMSHGWL